jgi:hypothetical protein
VAIALEITELDFAFPAGHRLIAISFVAGTLNSAAAFSIAAAARRCRSHAPPTQRVSVAFIIRATFRLGH